MSISRNQVAFRHDLRDGGYIWVVLVETKENVIQQCFQKFNFNSTIFNAKTVVE